MIKQIKFFLGIFLFIISLVSHADLSNVEQRGYLNVGITGDYPPFSLLDKKTNHYMGMDIDLAKNLAAFLKVKLNFIKTTWSTLATDLARNKFDIAMGGISVIPEREKQFIFSKPIVFDQKIALIRCTDNKKFTQLFDIDQNAVNVVENKGGANEAFARKHLQKAKIIVIPDNHDTFNFLLTKKADVMFTDSIEAKYQRQTHPELCVLELGRTISPIEPKAILLQKKDLELQKKINEWLSNLEKNGTLRGLNTKWLHP